MSATGAWVGTPPGTTAPAAPSTGPSQTAVSSLPPGSKIVRSNDTLDVWQDPEGNEYTITRATGEVARGESFGGQDRLTHQTITETVGGVNDSTIGAPLPGSGSGGEMTNTPQYKSLVDFANQMNQAATNFGGGNQAGTAAQIGEFGVTAPAPAGGAPAFVPNPQAVASNTAASAAYAQAQAAWNAQKPVAPTPTPNPNNDPGIAAGNGAAQQDFARAMAAWNAQKPAAPPITPVGSAAQAGAPGAPAPAAAPRPATGGPSIYGGPAAQMTAASLQAPSEISTPVVSGSEVAAQAITAPGGIKAPQMAKVHEANAQQIAAPAPVTTQQVGAQQIGPVGLGAGADANKASQDAAQSMLAGAAAGNAPSAAEALMRKGMDESAGAALGMAATLQGGRPGMALRTGLQGARSAMAKSAADAAALRANELATGRQQYSEATTAARGQDIQAAATNLSAQIDTLKANQQAALAAGNTNAANALQAQIASMQSQLDASKANQQSALQATLATQSTTADLAKANAANQLQAQIVSMQQQIEVAKQNAANALAAGQSNQANALQAQVATMTAQLDAMKANQQAQLATATTNAGLSQQANLTNATLAQQQSQFGATQQLSAAEKNQQAQMQQQALNNAQYLGLTQLQGQAQMAPYTAMVQSQAAEAAQQAMYVQMIAALAASDSTLKTDVEDGTAAALDFLDELPDPKTYRYIDEKKYYPGTQLGVMADDLPKSVVTTGPDGKKWISANVIGQVLAGLGVVHKQVKELRETTKMRRVGTRDTVPDSDVASFARKLAS